VLQKGTSHNNAIWTNQDLSLLRIYNKAIDNAGAPQYLADKLLTLLWDEIQQNKFQTAHPFVTRCDPFMALMHHKFFPTTGWKEIDFIHCLCAWKLMFVTEDSWQELVDYLQSVHKPRAMQVEAFVQRLKTMACYITDLPFAGAHQPPTLNNT
jgi:hypothetical protein